MKKLILASSLACVLMLGTSLVGQWQVDTQVHNWLGPNYP